MCYNVAYTEKQVQKLTERYQGALPLSWNVKNIQPDLPEYYFVSGFAHPLLPVVKQDGIFLFEWGLIPSWAKDSLAADNIRSKTLNAVGETIFEKPSFRTAIRRQRCLLPVNGFFEWREFGKKKYPYYIHATNNELFSLGCIYDTWVDRSTGEVKTTFSILTTPANPLMEKIHNIKKRMPLIISPENEARWINPSLSVEEIKKMILPFDEKEMSAFTISRVANSAHSDRNFPDILLPITYPELSPIVPPPAER